MSPGNDGSNATGPTRRHFLALAGAGAASGLLWPVARRLGADERPATTPAKEVAALMHPGLLHTAADLARMRAKVATGAEPWKAGWERLIANRHASLTWNPRPAQVIVRGNGAGAPQNYPQLYNDIAAAYACGLRWHVSGERAYADKAVQILNAWAATLKQVVGSSDRFLAAGIYGYEMANAAELLRDYEGWGRADFGRFQSMMLNVFAPMNRDFLVRHNGAKIDHYYCNWDACNTASLLAVGVLCDRRDLYEEAIHYFKHGRGNGAIGQAVVTLHPGGLGQCQESGRDQGHATLCVALLGAVCEMAWNQGDDLYGYDENRFLAMAEYVAKYNLGYEVPYTPYKSSLASQPVISPSGRGTLRPCWEMVYNHYTRRRGIRATYCEEFAAKLRPEGGGGDYGQSSGGFDQLGYGTLTFTR